MSWILRLIRSEGRLKLEFEFSDYDNSEQGNWSAPN